MRTPRAVRTATVSHAKTRKPYSSTDSTATTVSPVRSARLAAPVTQVPTGKVKLHQVNANGIPERTVRIVTAAASASHSSANPKTGTP